MRFALALSTLFALAIAPTIAHAQRNITDNPYPQTKKTPVPAPTSRTAQERHYRDSLRREFPVSSKGEACWRFLTEVSIPSGDGYFCFRERGKTLDSVAMYGNMATFYRGKWENITVDGRTGPIMVEWSEPGKAKRSTAIIQTLGTSVVPRSTHP